jgi:hypothetical protein
MIKSDTTKAFDRLEWHFVDTTFHHKGFYAHFINVIHACVSSPTFSIAITSQSYARFKSSRSLSHGSLMFTNDLLLCGKENVQETSNISNIVDQFCRASCQIPNWNKSTILFSKSVPLQVKEDLKQIFQVLDLDENTIHLRQPLILPAKDISSAYEFFYDKFQ